MTRGMRLCAMGLFLVLSWAVFAADETPGVDWNQAGVELNELLEQIDRALYLAVTGFTSYSAEDQWIAAQSLINLFEGADGPNFDPVGAMAEADGLLFDFAFNLTQEFSSIYDSLSGNEIYIYRDAVVHGRDFLRLAYQSALDTLPSVYSLFGSEDAFRATYAFLLAAKNGMHDPFEVGGLASLVGLLPEHEKPAPDRSLQDLVSKLPDGGTVVLESGTYRERIVISRSMTIRGAQNGGKTILEGLAWDPVIALKPDAPLHLVLEDLTIRGGLSGINASWLIGEEDVQATIALKNVRFEDNKTALAVSNADLTCVDCTFNRNDRAIRSFGYASIVLDRCTISNGTGPDGDISLGGAVELILRDSEIYRMAGQAIFAMDTVSMTLINNIIETAYSPAVAVVATDREVGGRAEQSCGGFMGTNEEELPLGSIAGHSNTITGGVCPVSLLFLTDPAPDDDM